jgi:hypothetical protein
MGKRMKIAGAVATGRSHQSSGAPCQDAIAQTNRSKCAVIALSDGAGSCRLSDIGSKIISEKAVSFVGDNFDRLLKIKDPEKIVSLIFESILSALSARANADSEESLKPYSGTLLLVAARKQKKNEILEKHQYFAIHIGDGAIGCVEDSKSFVVSHPENGEYSNSTFFITDSVAAQKIRYYTGECKKGSVFFLMSDGAAESLYLKNSGEFGGALVSMSEWIKNKDNHEMASVLRSNMEAVFTKKSTDDCSLIMMEIR